MNSTTGHWIFNLSPYIFEVEKINFDFFTSFPGIFLLLFIFGGGFFLSQYLKKSQQEKWAAAIQTLLIYGGVMLTLFLILKKMNVVWGLRWYSMMYLAGFVTVYLGCLHWVKKKTLMLTEDMLINFITVAILGMLLGARAGYVLIYKREYYLQHPWEAIATWEGGLSFHGGIVGVGIATIIFCRRYRIPFFHLSDKIVRLVPIGIGFGRIGNFFNGELWGRVASYSLPWGVIFPDGGPFPRHPSQIYQSLGEGWGLFLTLFLFSRRPQREGTLSALFVIFYSFYRFIVEYFRAADIQVNYLFLNSLTWGPLYSQPTVAWWQILTMGQILCFLFLIGGIILYLFTRKNIHEGSLEWRLRNEKFFAQNSPSSHHPASTSLAEDDNK